MRSCRRPVKCNTEPLGKSCGEELLSVQREKPERKLKKSKIHREKQKEKWAKQATQKKERNHDFFGSGVIAFDDDPHYSKFCEMWWKFSFISLLCSAKRHVNKICKSRSRTKARGKRKHCDGGLFDWHLSLFMQRIHWIILLVVPRVLVKILHIFPTN